MSARQLSGATYLRLKAATRELAKKCGGFEAAASITRVSFGHINKCATAEGQETTFLPIDVVADLESDCGVASVSRVLADLSGHLLIAKPPVNARGEWVRSIGDVSREVGEAVAAICTALADDGEVSGAEIKSANILSEMRDAEVALATLRLMVEQKLAEDERAGG